MALKRLLSWWRKIRGGRLDHLHFVVYTRADCHLCDVAWEVLQKARRHHGFRLTAVDVDASPELQARFGQQVPVVTLDGRVRFRGAVNAVLLRRLLRAEAARLRG